MPRRLGLNLTALLYYQQFSPYLNWWKVADAALVLTSGGNFAGSAAYAAGWLDPATGELPNPAQVNTTDYQRVFLSAAEVGSALYIAGAKFEGEEFTLEFTGSSGTPVLFSAGTGASVTMVNANKYTITLGTNVSTVTLRLSVPNRLDPPRSIKLYQSRYATNVANGETFNPDWLAEVSRYGLVRTMDWQATNHNNLSIDFADLADAAYTPYGAVQRVSPSDFGDKGSMHPELLCALAVAANLPVLHVCIPHKASDAFVTSFAEYIRDHAGLLAAGTVVSYEYTNEAWNPQFDQYTYVNAQGEATFWPGDDAKGNKWYGYRSCQVMQLIRTAYGASRSRWRGVIATQTVNTAATDYILIGVDYYLTNVAAPGTVTSDLFDELDVTSYFGDVWLAAPITDISQDFPAVVSTYYSPNGLTNGQDLMIGLHPDNGMGPLDFTYVTVAGVAAGSFQCSGVNSSGYPAFSTSGDNNAYYTDARIFRLFDESEQANTDFPGTYPTIYSLFNQLYATACMTGTVTSPDGTTVTALSVDELTNTIWPAQLAKATARGLGMRCYEGGCHFAADVYIGGFGGGGNAAGDRFADFVIGFGHSAECAAVYTASWEGFLTAGGTYPNKFSLEGPPSVYGTWGAHRFFPLTGNTNTEDANPVVVAMRAFNDEGDVEIVPPLPPPGKVKVNKGRKHQIYSKGGWR